MRLASADWELSSSVWQTGHISWLSRSASDQVACAASAGVVDRRAQQAGEHQRQAHYAFPSSGFSCCSTSAAETSPGK